MGRVRTFGTMRHGCKDTSSEQTLIQVCPLFLSQLDDFLNLLKDPDFRGDGTEGGSAPCRLLLLMGCGEGGSHLPAAIFHHFLPACSSEACRKLCMTQAFLEVS